MPQHSSLCSAGNTQISWNLMDFDVFDFFGYTFFTFDNKKTAHGSHNEWIFSIWFFLHAFFNECGKIKTTCNVIEIEKIAF